MTENQLLKKYELIKSENLDFFFEMLLYSSIFSIVLGTIIYFIKKDSLVKLSSLAKKSFSLVSIYLGIFAISLIIVSGIHNFKNSKEIDDWKINYAYTFIEKSKEYKEEIEYVTFQEPNYSSLFIKDSKKNANNSYTKKYTEDKKIKLTLALKKNGVLEENEGEFIVKYDLKENETPYITYNYLKSDLSSEVPKGKYNVIIHLK